MLAQGQSPQVLWIGCADSRVPETTVCHCKPGEIFVHRNIANTVHANDINAASVIEYAIIHLRVNKVVVCGHTKCGGANAALGDADLGHTLNTWLHPVREYVHTHTTTCAKTLFFLEREGEREETPLNTSRLRRKHKAELASLPNDDARSVRVAELNIQHSVDVLRGFPVVKKAMAERGLTLHGLLYDIGVGQLRVVGEAKGSGYKANGLWTPNRE